MKYILISLLLTFNAIAYESFITPLELKNSLKNSNLILLDVSSLSNYKEGHISGALHADISKFIKSKHKKTALDFSQIVQKELMKLGIDENSDVVIYSRNQEEDQLNSSYLAFILIQHGFENVTILNGGYMAWVFKYHDLVSTEKSEPLKKGTFTIDKNSDFLVSSDYLKKNLSNIALLDSSETSEHNSTILLEESDASEYTPCIKNRYYRDNFFSDLTLRSDLEIRESFIYKLDLKSDKEIVVFGDTVFSASMNWYILYKKFGFKNTKIYDGTFK